MRAVKCTKYGPPEVLEFIDIEKPIPKDNEILVKVLATSVHIGDTRIRRFDISKNPIVNLIAKIILGFRGPRKSILGMELSGIVEEVGEKVQKFNIGDEIFASTGFNFGAYVEYKTFKETELITKKPSNFSFEESATTPNGAFTALCIIKQANLQKNQKILIYGASGSIGTFAIQFAKNLGANVTAVCSGSNIHLVKSLGADKAIDYTKEDFINEGTIYDVVFDAVDKYPRDIAKKYGKIYLNVDSSSNKCKFKQESLIELKSIIEDGNLKTVIDKTYTLDEIREAHRYVDTGHKKGNVVIKVSN